MSFDRDMREEMRFHVERQTEENIRRGMAPDEARRQALLTFGGVARYEEQARAARRTAVLENLRRDVRYALRSLGRSPLFTAAVVLTLGLGIGATSAIFSVVNGVLLQPLPWADANRLAMVWETDRNTGTLREAASVPDYFDFLERQRVFTGIAAFAQVQRGLTAADTDPAVLNAALATANLFSLLGVPPMLGRGFTEAEDRPGGPRVAVIGERLWRTRFAGATDIVGRVITIDDQPTTVIGVAPASLEFPARETELWLPAQLGPTSAPRDNHIVTLVARLAPGVRTADAQAAMTAVAADLEAEYPGANAQRGVHVEPVTDVLVGSVRPALRVLLAAVGLMLLVACANAASLLLARAAAREHELAVRTALGATAARLRQQAFVESAVLALGAATLGLVLARLGLRTLLAFAPPDLPRLGHVSVNGAVLAVTLAVALIVAAAFSALPRLAGGLDAVRAALSGAGRTITAGHGHRRFRRTLVVAELALAVVLVTSAGVLMRSFSRLVAVDPGFAPERLLRASMTLPPSRYPQDFAYFPSWPEIQRFHREVVARVAALPGVQSAALAVAHPLDPAFTNSFVIVGREAERATQPELPIREVTPEYFRTVGVPVLRGRGFLASDDSTTDPVLLVNQAMAARFFPGADPIGQGIRFWGTTRTIVGVVGDEKLNGLAAADPPALYAPMPQAPMRTFTLLVRTTADPRPLVPVVQRTVWSVDPSLPLFGVATMDETLARSVARERFTALLVVVFAGVALALAAIGVHGVLSYTVAQRTREIGVRTALGATARDVVRLFVREGAVLGATGLALGITGAAAAGLLLRGLLFGVSAWDPATYALVLGTVATVTLAACWLPARRAARVNPVEALRQE